MSSNFNQDENKNASELEREMDTQRSNIEKTITELLERLSPGQVFTQLLNSGGGSGDMSRKLMNAMRDNPVPAFIAATGLGWLLISQNRSQGGSSTGANAMPARESYGVDPDYDPHAGEGHVALGKTASARGTARRYGSDLERFLREQPLAVGAIGLAVGALVGASMPRTRREDQVLGRYGDQLSEQASEFGDEARQRFNESVGSTGPGGDKTQH